MEIYKSPNDDSWTALQSLQLPQGLCAAIGGAQLQTWRVSAHLRTSVTGEAGPEQTCPLQNKDNIL